MAKSISKSSTLSPVLKNECATQNLLIYISNFIAIVIFAVIIVSLNNLEHSNCKCADLPYRKFLKEWFVFAIFYIIALLSIFSVSNEACWSNFKDQPYIYAAMLIFTLIHIIMLIRLFLYVRLLRNDCNCGYGNKEKFIYWYLVIIFSIWVAIIVFTFIAILLTIIKFFSSR